MAGPASDSMLLSSAHTAPTTTIEALSPGLPSFIRTLEVMALAVRTSRFNSVVRRRAELLLKNVTEREPFAEARALFFSFVTTFVSHPIRSALNSSRTLSAHLRAGRATAMTRLYCLPPCWQQSATELDLSPLVTALMTSPTFTRMLRLTASGTGLIRLFPARSRVSTSTEKPKSFMTFSPTGRERRMR